jgi:hypothetical protein
LYDERADLLTALKSGPTILRNLLDAIDSAQPSAEDGWSPVEIVCHLRDAERIALERDRRMHAEDRPQLAAYDQDELAEQTEYKRHDINAALQEFEDVRSRHVAFLTGLSGADWDRSGVHEEVGEITIRQHVAHIAAHDPLHFAQLARLK